MDFQIETVRLLNFLTKCKLDKMIPDLLIKIKDARLSACFMDNNDSCYCEVYENNLKVNQEGVIRVASLEKLFNTLSRIDSEMIRLVSNESQFLISDGSKPGKSKIKFTQHGEDNFVDSYKRIVPDKINFSIKELKYRNLESYKNGFEISLANLQVVLKDAKAFGFDLFKFNEKEGILNCTIEDRRMADSFNRKIITDKKIGGEIPEIYLGIGFREILNSLEKEKLEETKTKTVQIFVTKKSVLITNQIDYFYNLHTVELEA